MSTNSLYSSSYTSGAMNSGVPEREKVEKEKKTIYELTLDLFDSVCVVKHLVHHVHFIRVEGI